MLTATISLHAQNHVPNHSFEDTLACPRSANQVTSHCKNWYSYIPASSPDYYHSCDVSLSQVGVPYNGHGHQPAYGNAYCGFAVYANYNIKVGKKITGIEYIATDITPLTADSFYEVSMSVAISDYSVFAVDGFGAYFFKDGPDTFAYKDVVSGRVPVTPQADFYHHGIVDDTTYWTRLTTYMLADSAYDHIVLGVFKDTGDIQVKYQPYRPWQRGVTYYFVDSVVVQKAPPVNMVLSDTLLCTGDTILLTTYMHPKHFLSGNIFNVELSDKNGSFNSPVIIGTATGTTTSLIKCAIPASQPAGNHYRVRITSNKPAYTSDDNGVDIRIGPARPARPSVTAKSQKICDGDTIQFNAVTTTPNVDWYWVLEPAHTYFTQSSIFIHKAQLADSGLYKVYASNSGCLSEPDSIDIKILENVPPAVVISDIKPGSTAKWGTDVTFYTIRFNSGKTSVYTWFRNSKVIPNETDSIYTGTMGISIFHNDTICVRTTQNTHQCPTKDTAVYCARTIRSLGIVDAERIQTIVYPNPANSSITIESGKIVSGIKISTMLGREVHSKWSDKAYNSLTTDIKILQPGVYLLYVMYKDGSTSVKRITKF